MRTIWIVVAVAAIGAWVICVPAAHAQIVPNPDFEIHTNCPVQHSQLVFAVPWVTPTNASPDYFHTCGTGTAAVPANLWGTQSPFSGDAYAGAISYNSLTEEREYLQAPLNSALIANQVYTFSMWVSLADVSGFAIDGMGVHFSVGPVTQAGFGPLPVIPQVENPTGNILADSNGWTQVSGTFVAAGGENTITIGNFRNDANTMVTPTGGANIGSIYYIDGVSFALATVPVEPSTWGRVKALYGER